VRRYAPGQPLCEHCQYSNIVFVIYFYVALQRERCLELADRAGLNVNAVTKRVVELMRATPGLALEAASGLGESPLTAKSRTITPEDEVAIRAIEWLTFDPDQRIDALIHANALARKFIGTSTPLCCGGEGF
jgi:hypothetical protein